MRISLIIADNFYNDPDEVRRAALSANFCQRGNYPGQRTLPFLNESIRSTIQSLVNRPIIAWQGSYNGAFQYTTCRDRSWIHTDQYNNWAGVLFLTPNAPLSAGTAFYRHNETGLIGHTDDAKLRSLCDRDSNDYTKWTKYDEVANVFNRLVLFDSTKFHASQDYFGKDLSDGRLFQTFFFNTTD